MHGISDGHVFMCLSVCLSQAGIVGYRFEMAEQTELDLGLAYRLSST